MKNRFSLFFLTLLSATLFSGCLNQEATVVIDAPIDVVWKYVSDSSKASEWSIFLEKIEPLPGIPDGQPGAVRRCYRKINVPSASTWDEEIIDVQAPYFRQIRTFNLQRFSIHQAEESEFFVFQKLRSLGPDRTELTLASKAIAPRVTPFNALPFMRAYREAAEVIRMNVENIKFYIENPGTAALPPHQYLEVHSFDR